MRKMKGENRNNEAGELIDMSDMDEKWSELVTQDLVEFIEERNLSIDDVRKVLNMLDSNDEYLKCPVCGGMNVDVCSECDTGFQMICNDCWVLFWEDD